MNSNIATQEKKAVDYLEEHNYLAVVASKREQLKISDTWPANLQERFSQRAIVFPKKQAALPGPNGDANRYICFLAQAYPVVYYSHRNIAEGQWFPLAFPIAAFEKMMTDAIPIPPHEYFCAPYTYEIHFRKVNKNRYELLFLAKVEEKAKPFGTNPITGKDILKHERIQVDYMIGNYKPEKAFHK